MRKANIKHWATLALAVPLSLTAASAYAHDVDVTVEHRDGKGCTTRAVTSSENLSEIRKQVMRGNDMRILKKLAPERFKDPAGGEEQQEGYKVLFAVAPEENEEYTWDPWKVYVTRPDGEYSRDYYNYAYKPDAEMEAEGYQWGCYVPDGVYDVILSTGRFSMTGSFIYAYIVKENVSISGDTTITFRQSDAKNLLTAKFRFEDGEVMPQFDEDSAEGYGYGYSRCLNHKGGSYGLNMVSFGGVRDSILVNDLTDNWTYAINQVAVTPKGAYVNKLVVPGPFTGDTVITNNPEDYVETYAKFNPLDSTDMKLNAFGVNSFMTWKGADWDCSAGLLMQYDGDYTGEVKMLLNVGRSDMSAETGYDVFVSPLIGQNVFTYTIDMGDGEIQEEKELLYAGGAYMVADDNDEYLYINGSPEAGYKLEQYPDERFFLPAKSPFAFTTSEMTYFEFAPVMRIDNLSSNYNEWVEADILNGYPCTSYPTFESWSLPAIESVTNNGETYVLRGEERLWDWSAEGNYVPGPVEICYNGAWCSLGGRQLATTSTFRFDTSNQQYNPPMVEQYQVRNGDNRIVKIVNTEGKIMFGVKDEDNDLTEVNVKVAVSGSGEWTELECVNIPACDDLSSYGYYYEASLSSLNVDADTLYDLQFCCEDALGNSSEALIEGAFVLGSTVGATAVETESCPIKIEGRRIVAPQDAAVFNLNGMSIKGDSLDKGVYFVIADGRTYKVIIR